MSPILRTPLCDLLGIDVPIMQAGMGNVAYGRMAAAVSNAGGLGSIGGIDIPPEEVDAEIKLFRSRSSRPLCVDLGFPANAPTGLADVQLPELPGPLRQLKRELGEHDIEIVPTTDQAISLADNKRKLEIALGHGTEVIACALGTPAWVVEACHAKGAKVMSIVGLAKHARGAIRNGTDIVIVQGTEGGGHTGDVGLITLLAEVLEFSTVPVVAAGGLVKGAQIAACLTMGAQGAGRPGRPRAGAHARPAPVRFRQRPRPAFGRRRPQAPGRRRGGAAAGRPGRRADRGQPARRGRTARDRPGGMSGPQSPAGLRPDDGPGPAGAAGAGSGA